MCIIKSDNFIPSWRIGDRLLVARFVFSFVSPLLLPFTLPLSSCPTNLHKQCDGKLDEGQINKALESKDAEHTTQHRNKQNNEIKRRATPRHA
jgi:hypothetical protein